MRWPRLEAGPGPKPKSQDRLGGAVGKDNPFVCRVDTGTMDLTARRLAGATFRHRLSAAGIRDGALLAQPDLTFLFEWDESDES